MTTVSHAVAGVLKDAGIDHMFGFPGGEVTSFMEAARQLGIRFVLTKHEAQAAFMAGAYGEITGRPGVCVSTIAPGATNLLSGVAGAYLDRAPLIAITGQMTRRMQSIATHQRLETGRLFANVTKWQAVIDPGSAAATVRKAIKFATSDRPGPVHLEMASDVANLAPAEEPVGAWSPTAREHRAAFSPADVREAIAAICAAKRPALLVGLGALKGDAGEASRLLAERLGAPVVLAPKAKGVIPEDHPLVAGVIEMLGDGVVIELTRRADLLIAIGFDPVELDKPWLFDVPVIHIDSVPNYDGYYPSALEVVGDIASAVGAITGGLPVSGTGWTLSEIEASKKTLERLITRPGSGMAGHEVVRIAREELPADTIATCDVGAHKMLVGQLWKAYRPREFFMSNGLSSMGYGFPTALVAKMLHPDRPVIAFVGDGGMSMYLGELETAVRLGTNLIAVVMCDQSLSLIKMNQERKGIPYTGVEFANPDYGKVAECMGAAGFRAGTPQALLAALRSARSCNRPAVIHADIDGAPYRLQ